MDSLLATLIRHRALVVFCVALCAAIGLAYSRRATPIYEATSIVRFELDRVDLPQLVEQLASDNMISTELEVLRGRSAAASAVDSLGLRATVLAPRHAFRSNLFSTLKVLPAADSGTLVLKAQGNGLFTIARTNSDKSLDSARIGRTVTVAGVMFALAPAAQDIAEIRLQIAMPEAAVEGFRSGLKIFRPARDADLIAIRAQADDPVTAARAANLMANNIIAGRQTFLRSRTSTTTAFLEEQAETLRQQLRKAENSLETYKEREHVIDVPEQARSQVTRLAGLQANLAVVRADRDAFSRLIEEMRQDTTGQSLGGQAPSRRLMAFPTLLQNQTASVLLGSLAQVETKRADLLIRRTSHDPDVQVLTQRIKDIESQLQGIAESFRQSLSNQVASLEGEATNFVVELDALPEKALESARLERDARVLSDLWVLVQTRLKEAQITGGVGEPTVRLVDAAAPPLRPVRPNVPINLALSVVLGTMIGLTLAVAQDYRDRSVRSRADALAAVGLPVLGAFPQVTLRRSEAVARDGGKRSAGIAPLLLNRPGAPPVYAESFSQVFVNLALADRGRKVKVVVFTSPLPGEGKTITATNFALVGASRGLRMLLVDADLRCGVISTLLKCPRTPGLAELLGGSVHFGAALHTVPLTENGSLTVIPSGALPKVPGRLLTVERLQAMLTALTPEFDFIVIDTPPVNLLADAAMLGSMADAVLLVVRAGHTQIDDLRFAMEQLDSAGARVVGTLLNDIDLRRNARDDGSYHYLAEAGRYGVVAS